MIMHISKILLLNVMHKYQIRKINKQLFIYNANSTIHDVIVMGCHFQYEKANNHRYIRTCLS